MPQFRVGDVIEFEPGDAYGTWTGEIVAYDPERIALFSAYDYSDGSYLVKVGHVMDGPSEHGWLGNESGERFWWVDHDNATIRMLDGRRQRPFYLVSPVFAGGAE